MKTVTENKDYAAMQTALFGQGKVTAFVTSDGKLRWSPNGTCHSFKSLAKAMAFLTTDEKNFLQKVLA